jgi:ketosteroid isomerase-like protein
MNKIACIAALALLAGTTACTKAETAKIDEAVAAKASDDMLATALSGDLAKVDAMYAGENVVAVDAVATDLATNAEQMHKFNVGFLSLKFDKMSYTERKIQVLDGDDFVVTAKVHAESSTGPIKTTDFRLTDLFQKQADGTFKIVNEHISFAQPAPK